MNILIEEPDKQVPLLVLVHNISDGGALAEELHEASLHRQPEEPGQVEEERQEDEVEWNPLIVRVVDHRHSVGVIRLGREGNATKAPLNRKYCRDPLGAFLLFSTWLDPVPYTLIHSSQTTHLENKKGMILKYEFINQKMLNNRK